MDWGGRTTGDCGRAPNTVAAGGTAQARRPTQPSRVVSDLRLQAASDSRDP